MSETKTIVCDGCGADLKPKSGERLYRLVLKDDTFIVPPPRPDERRLDGDKHFCGLACLGDWLEVDRQRHFAALRSGVKATSDSREVVAT